MRRIRITRLAALCAALLAVPAFAQQPADDEAYVRANSVVRAAPSTRAAVLHRVGEPRLARVLGCSRESGGWCHVQLAGGGQGWVAESRLEDLPGDSLDHRTSTPLAQRGVLQGNADVVFDSYYGPTVFVESRGGPGEPPFPMRPGWARGQPMPR